MAQKILTPDEAKALEAKTGEKDTAERGQKWLQRIAAAEKKEDDWMKDAAKAERDYAAKRDTSIRGAVPSFNIVHSNVETIVPAIYNSTPVPDIRSRNTLPDVEDPPEPQPQQGPDGQPIPPQPQELQAYQVAKLQADAMKAQIQAVKNFATMLERNIALQIDDNKLDTEMEAAARDAYLAGRGIVRVHVDIKQFVSLRFEAVSWKDFRHGPAKRWDQCPWVAFKHVASHEEAERLGDKELMESQKPQIEGRDRGGAKSGSIDEDIVIWEIWCEKKEGIYVEFVRASDGVIMKSEPAPIRLGMRFPMLTPIQPITLTGDLTPVCPATIYYKLADELDVATKRIGKIMQGLKLRGIVAGMTNAVLDLQKLEDNELMAANEFENLAQFNGDLSKAVLWWPVEQAIKVLQQLYAQREMTKQAIYEITGISDIVRGATEASETATAQQIKSEWGSLRIKRMQNLITRGVRDLFVIASEMITQVFPPEQLSMASGIAIDEHIQTLLQNEALAYFRVDVESDSTVRADTSRRKAEMAEFIAGSGQFFQGMAPLAQANPKAAKPIAKLYGSIVDVFNLGKKAGDALDELEQIAEETAKQAGDQPDPMQAAMMAEQQKFEAEEARKDAEHKQKLEAEGQKMQYAEAEHNFKMDEMKAASNIEGLRLANAEIERQNARQREDGDREFERQAREEDRNFARETHQSTIERAKAEAGIPIDYSFEKDRANVEALLAQSQKTDEAMAKVVETVAEGQQTIAAAMTAIAEAINKPRTGRAVKQKDGSWATENS